MGKTCQCASKGGILYNKHPKSNFNFEKQIKCTKNLQFIFLKITILKIIKNPKSFLFFFQSNEPIQLQFSPLKNTKVIALSWSWGGWRMVIKV